LSFAALIVATVVLLACGRRYVPLVPLLAIVGLLLVGVSFGGGAPALRAVQVGCLLALAALLALWRRHRVGSRIWNLAPLLAVRALGREIERIGEAALDFIFPASVRREAGTLSARLFPPFFVLYVSLPVIWLVAGLVPAVAAAFPAVHALLHEWSRGSNLIAALAGNAARASHSAYGPGQVAMDYAFSILNLGFGIFLVLRGPRHLAARLLAVGMVGTAVAFNLQGHFANQIALRGWLGPIAIWHEGWIHAISGVCYVFALLLFPDGKLLTRRRAPYLIFVTTVFVFLSLLTVEDHTFGLVLVFGILTPIAGANAQLRRYRAASNPEQRQQSKLLLWGLGPAIGVAVFLVIAGNVLAPGKDFSQTTKTYEFKTPGSGTYFFRCDPHPEEMTGTLLVEPESPLQAGQPTATISARNGLFDKRTLSLPPGQEVALIFTNNDGDQHNVAVYTNASASHEIFVGQEFSGQKFTALAFRVFQPVFIIIPIALLVGLLRFRLWDMDKVIDKALVYAALGAFITAVYVGVVVGISTAVGSTSGRHLGLSIVATAIVAFAFEPMRERLQQIADRVVFGRRATPYEFLAKFSERVAGTYSGEDGLSELARVISEGTGAAHAEVWLRRNGHLVSAATWPRRDSVPEAKLSFREGRLPEFADVNRVAPVRDQGELLGVLTVTKGPGEELSPVEDRLLTDLAAQSGLVLRNLGLTEELQSRVDEVSRQAANLLESRRRIVATQDARRQQLERDIHDGAQQHLVALAVKLRLAQTLAASDPERARPLLAQLRQESRDALETLRDLARGIYPPLLAKGLVTALRSQAQKTGMAVRVDAGSIDRYPLEIEAAVYFCCLEALQNVAKYAYATSVVVTLRAAGSLTFSVEDDGMGFDAENSSEGTGLQNMADRIDAVGGAFEVRSKPGKGTAVIGCVPIPDGEMTR